MQVGKKYPVIGKDYFYRILSIVDEKVTYIRAEDVINPDTGNTVNILGTEHVALVDELKERVATNQKST